jgi:RimJ/RimL family protein N-acetyltransferase
MDNLSAVNQLSTNRIVLKRLEERNPQLPPDAASEAFSPRLSRLGRSLTEAMKQSVSDHLITFAIVIRDTGAEVGLAHLFHSDRDARRATLGAAWTSASAGRTIAAHVACLMLRFGFEGLGCYRLDLRSDAGDKAAGRTFQRLGFRREGVLRFFEDGPDGEPADIAMWSVIFPEWPKVKLRLQAVMAEEDWPWKDRLPAILPP